MAHPNARAPSPKKRKASPTPERQVKRERVNTAVYVTNLPKDASVDEIHDVFSKYGIIAESIDDNTPRITVYRDDTGELKGDALIVYFKPQSVDLAIQMADETDFRWGERQKGGPMRVKLADFSFKQEKELPADNAQGGEGPKTAKKGKEVNTARVQAKKKAEQMNRRLADWDDDDPQTMRATSARWDKVVVLKHMFTLDELADDPAALLDITEDVRDEASKCGPVGKVVLFDQEEEGVVTVRFNTAQGALACVGKLNGRAFDGRVVEAYIADGSEKFKKSRKSDEDEEEEETRRLEKLSGGNEEED